MLTRADRGCWRTRTHFLLGVRKISRGGRRPLRTRKHLPELIKKTEESVVKFAERWEPQLAHFMQASVQELGKAAGKFVFAQKGREMSHQTDAPVVVVTQALHRWIDAQVHLEGTAHRAHRDDIRDLFDIATAKDPAKEAKGKEKAAEEERGCPRTQQAQTRSKTAEKGQGRLERAQLVS